MIFILIGRLTPKSPKIPDPSSFDSGLDGLAVAAQLIERDEGLNEKARLVRLAEGEGLRPTKGSGYTRYDTRRGMASKINDALDVVDERLLVAEKEIYNIRSNIYENLPNWRKGLVRWVKIRSLSRAAIISVKMATIAFGCGVILSSIFPEFYREIIEISGLASKHIFFEIVDSELTAALIVPVVIGYGTLAFSYWKGRDIVYATIDHNQLYQWQYIEDKWNPDEGYEDFDIYRNLIAEETSEEQEGHATTDSGNHWSNVLGVSLEANADEIKAAYRNLMKAYHSDRVVNLGPKLQAVAEEETKRINLAYEQAKNAISG